MVRPLAGAGIEMLAPSHSTYCAEFAPSRGRELKYLLAELLPPELGFAPSRGRELKFDLRLQFRLAREFAPSRGRELKL